MQTLESLGLFGLFCICFISSSLYPLGSEVFVSFFATLDYPLFLVWSVATIGNTLGSLSTYAIGYWGENFILAKHFTKPKNFEKYLVFVGKYGFVGYFCICFGGYALPFFKSHLFYFSWQRLTILSVNLPNQSFLFLTISGQSKNSLCKI